LGHQVVKRSATHFTFTRAEMAAWIKGVKAGEFDDFC